MGKHKNRTQNSIFIEFMEKYPDVARGFTKRDKPTLESLWQQLTESLNSAGPPQKDMNGWKKVWTDWKSDVKRKLAQNKVESRATGGGPFSKFQLSSNEETIVRICGIAQSVEGVVGIAVGLPENVDADCEKEMPSTEDVPSTSTKRPVSPILMSSTPKRRKTENIEDRLKKFLDEDNERKVEMNEKLDELLKIEKENASSLRRVYRAIEKGQEAIASAITGLKEEFVRINRGILQTMHEKNELKKKQLDLELMKFEYQKKK